MKTIGILAGLLVIAIALSGSFAAGMGFKASNVSVGSGSKYMAVAYGNNTYVTVWYNYTGAYLNATAINAADGTVKGEKVISTDIYTYNNAPSVPPAIAYDDKDKAFVVMWVNSSRYLEAVVIDSNLNVIRNEFTVNDTTGVSYKGIALGYGGGKFLAVWSDSSYHLEARFMNRTYNGTVFRITNFNGKEQKSPWIGYDESSNRFMVTWVNVTQNATGTKFYNISGKIIDAASENFVTGDILIADAFTDQSSYTAPTVSGGAGEFFVTYVTYISPRNITAKIYDSNGNMVAGPINIGNTYYYGRSQMPSVYTGSNFTVVWSNSTEAILAQSYSTDGTPLGEPRVIYSGTNGGNPHIAYSSDDKTYFFTWTEFQGSGKPYILSGAIWTVSEFVPEFNLAIAVGVTAIVGMVVIRRKH